MCGIVSQLIELISHLLLLLNAQFNNSTVNSRQCERNSSTDWFHSVFIMFSYWTFYYYCYFIYFLFFFLETFYYFYFILVFYFFLDYCQCLRPYNPVHTVYTWMWCFYIFRSTSKSRPNNIRGGECPSESPSVRPYVRPQKVSSIWMKFCI